jgi:tetratricopeptide (TPR) repeat protein
MPYHIKGTESLILNDPSKGIEAYSRIIEKRPDDWFPYNQRGYLYILTGQSELASGNIEKSAEIYELAWKDIEKSIELGPDAEWPYMWATLIALRQGRLNGIPTLMQSISQTKQSDFIKNLMTTMYGEEKATLLGASMSTMEQLSKGQYIFSIQNANAVLATMPTYAEMYLLKGLSYCNLDDHQNAESAYTQGLTIDPSFTVLYLLRAEVRAKLGNADGAGADLAFVQQSVLHENLKEYLVAAQSGQFSCKQLIPSK